MMLAVLGVNHALFPAQTEELGLTTVATLKMWPFIVLVLVPLVPTAALLTLQRALLASFGVTMVSVLPPLSAAMERLVDVVMAVMREDALPVRVEHSCAVMDNASNLLTVVMGLKNALMAVMRLDVLRDMVI